MPKSSPSPLFQAALLDPSKKSDLEGESFPGLTSLSTVQTISLPLFQAAQLDPSNPSSPDCYQRHHTKIKCDDSKCVKC